MSEFPTELRRQLIPNGNRRAPWHDRSRCIYMITINAAKNMPPFSQLTGIPGNHDFKPKCNNTFIGETIAEAPVLHQKQFPFHKHSTARHHA